MKVLKLSLMEKFYSIKKMQSLVKFKFLNTDKVAHVFR